MSNNIYLDGMMGLVVGDALGSPCQFRDRSEFIDNPVKEMIPCRCFGTPAGSFTDDSSLALATLYSLKEKGKVDVYDIADQHVRWLQDGEFTPFGKAYDIGNGCYTGIERYAKTKDIKSGADGVNNNGNGSLMKILPLCIFLYEQQKRVCTSEDECIQLIHDVSGITHRHLRSMMGCGLYYFLVKHVIKDKNNKSLIQCLQEGINEGMAYYGKDLRNLAEKANYYRLIDMEELKKISADEIKTSGYVVHTLEAAVWNLITTNSYEDCLIQTVNLGDDADSVGAVAGGLAGLYYGYDNIPDRWINAIQRKEWIEEMCGGLDETVSESEERIIAKKDDWTTFDMPEEHDNFILEMHFTKEMMENLKYGNIPEEMEDKWFWYFDNNKLYAHRSWTGYCVFIVSFNPDTDKHEVIVNRFKEQYKSESIEEDKKLLVRLLRHWVQPKYSAYDEWLEETAIALSKSQDTGSDIKSNIYLENGDITKLECDCIVNAANNSLLGGGGVDGAIHRAAGPGLLKECRTLNGCKTGEAKITKGYNLPAKYVIHTVGPVYSGNDSDARLLASCYESSLNLAKENNIHSIAFCAISTGVYRYPLKEATETAVKTVMQWLSDNREYIIDVVFCCYDDETYNVYDDILKREQGI